MYPCEHKIKNTVEQTSKLKRKKKKNEMLLNSNPHLLSEKYSLLSIRLLRNCDFVIKSNCATILSSYFTKIPEDGKKGH